MFWGGSAQSGTSSTSPTALSPRGLPHSSAPDSASAFACPQSRDRKVLGDNSGAQSYGSTAKCLNITALVINIVIVVIVVTVTAVLLTRNYTPYYGHNPY